MLEPVKTTFLIAVLAPLSLLVGCHDRAEQPPKQPPAKAIAGSPAVDLWPGRWTGPEGTFLVLSRTGDRFDITIQDLDGPAQFEGKAAGDHIEFERSGKTESIRATNGIDTGMKWLQDKTDCLTIKPGEGYCR